LFDQNIRTASDDRIAACRLGIEVFDKLPDPGQAYADPAIDSSPLAMQGRWRWCRTTLQPTVQLSPRLRQEFDRPGAGGRRWHTQGRSVIPGDHGAIGSQAIGEASCGFRCVLTTYDQPKPDHS
jgi:hypothetical protein